MSLKPRSMVLQKGKVEDKYWFIISDTTIPTITEKPVKSLPKNLISIAFYGHNNKLLPFKSLEEELKVRPREVVQYRNSSDPMVANAGIQVRTGRKWKIRS